MKNLEKIAAELFEAEEKNAPIDQITKTNEGLDVDDAYAIQNINIQKKLDNGQIITGKKIGLTSKAMQNSLGVDTPDYGFLLDSMEIKDGKVKKEEILQPRVEGELAFILNKDINGDSTYEEIIDATEYVVPALEIVGSRIKDWKLTIVDTVADNASCGMYLLSDKKIDLKKTDLKKISMSLHKNGEKINEGVGSDVLGDPAKAVMWLAKAMGNYGVSLKKGDVILAGALSAAISAEPGDQFTCDYGEFGKLSVEFTD